MGYPTQQQKVDYLFKKIGFTKTKTGVAEDQTSGFSGDTKKAPPNEAIASPLIVPGSSVWSDSSFITATPPTSSTAYVGVYSTATAYRMTVDTTVANERTFIARQTWGNPSSAIEGDWIDTQFGANYLVKVYMGDPSTGTPGVAYTNLSAAGTSGKDDVWFFDYSSGVLNFNGADLDGQLVGIHTDNVYLVGYRYIGRKGIQPPAGIGTFHDLVVSNNLSVGGISTFTGLVDANGGVTANTLIVEDLTNNRVVIAGTGGEIEDDANLTFDGAGLVVGANLNVTGVSTFGGIIDATAGQNKIPSLYQNFSDLPNASTYHGMFAHVHALGRGYFAHGGAWYELVNKESSGVVGTGTERYNIGPVDATSLNVTGITTLGSIGISTGRITGPAITYIDPVTVGDDTGTVVIKGNLQIDGTQTTVNSSTMDVADKNVGIASGAANDAAADGAGLTVYAGSNTDKTWQWLDATDSWTSSEHIRIPDGKVFGFTPDTDTHISRPTADQLLLTTGGTGRARFLNTQTKIGPDADSATESTNYEFQISSYTGPVCHIFSLKNSNSASVSNVLKQAFMFKNAGGTSVDLARIQVQCTDFSTGTENGDLSFYTTNNGTQGEKLRITSDGKVGIGTDNPQEKLHITDPGNPKILIEDTNSSNQVGVRFKTPTQDWIAGLHGGTGFFKISKHTAFGTNDYFTINGSGNVGINSTVPTAKLDVVGDTIIQGNLNVTGVSTFTGNIIANGNIGIGTAVPTAPLHISGPDAASAKIKIEDNNNGFAASEFVVQNGGRDLRISSPQDIYFTKLGGATLLTLENGQNVGIGTDNPSAPLDVFGNTKLRNDVDIDGNLDVDGRSELDIVNISETLSVSGISTFSKEVGISSSVNISGVTTTADIKVSAGSSVTIPEHNDNTALFLGNFTTPSASGSDGARLKQNTTGNTTFEFNNLFNTGKNFYISAPSAGGTLFLVSDNTTIGTRLYNGGNNVKLQTVGTGITVFGTIQTQQLNVSGVSTFTDNATFNGTISAGSTTGTDGYYLKSVGTGVTWAAFPTVRTGLTTTATAGQSSFNFSYNVGYVDVFLNGVKLPESEFTATNGSTIVLDDAAFANDTLEFISLNTTPGSSSGAQVLDQLNDVTITGTPVTGETLQHNGSEFVNDYTVTATTTSTSQTAILNLGVATYRSVEYTIQITEGTKYHVTKVLAIHDGTNVTFNEYGTLFTTSSLSTFALDVSSGNMRLLATPASTNSTVFKVKFTGIKV